MKIETINLWSFWRRSLVLRNFTLIDLTFVRSMKSIRITLCNFGMTIYLSEKWIK